MLAPALPDGRYTSVTQKPGVLSPATLLHTGVWCAAGCPLGVVRSSAARPSALTRNRHHRPMPPCVLRVEGEGGGATELTAEFCPDGSAPVVLLFSGDHVEVRAQTPTPTPTFPSVPPWAVHRQSLRSQLARCWVCAADGVPVWAVAGAGRRKQCGGAAESPGGAAARPAPQNRFP